MPTSDNVRRFVTLMEPRERRRLLVTLDGRVRADPENREPLTALLWAVVCDLADAEVAEEQLAADIDGWSR